MTNLIDEGISFYQNKKYPLGTRKVKIVVKPVEKLSFHS